MYNSFMDITPHDDINALLDVLLKNIQSVLHNKLVGLYLYGSLTAGDFDPKISDIDLLAVVSETITDKELEALKQMHAYFANEYPSWNDRIEAQYASVSALQTFKTQKSRIVTISPGEPIHFVDAGKDWLLNWYDVQEHGKVLFGPSQSTFIPSISKDEYTNATKENVLHMREWIQGYTSQSPRGPFAFVVLTLCRALYGYQKGEQVSKTQAAMWAKRAFPEWAALINDAIVWRNSQWDKVQKRIGSDLQRVLQFEKFVLDQIVEN